MIPVANAGTLVLYDSITEHLIMKAAVGFSPTINLFKTKVGEGITGKVFQDGQPRIFNSTIEIYKKMNENSISKENLNFLILSVKDGYVKAMISVPVSIGDKRIGVMTVHQMDSEGKFTKRDLDLLQGFGSQAAIAIQNAKLYSQLNEKLKELSKRNEVHETLIHLSLQNKGIKKIIDKIGKMINRNVVFFDYLENEWYYSRKNQKSNFSIDEISVIFSNRTSGVIVDVLKPNEETYYLYPIINGSVFLGCFIIELSNPLAVLERIIIQQGGSILALELVKKHTLEEIYYKKTHEFFTEILQKKDSDELVSNEKEFHLNPASFFFVGVIEIIDYKDLQKLEADIYSLVSLIKRENSKVNLIYGFHNKIIFLVSALNSSFLNNSIYDLKTIINTWAINRNNSIYVGIGSTYKGIHHVAKSYDEAKKAISYLLNFKGTGIITYEEIGVNRLFINQDPNEIERFLNDFFIPLKTNRSKKNDLEKTLLTYIAHNKSINDTSKALHIHVNTLYQRLKKIEEVLEVNFNDPKDFLKIQLACYLKETFTVS